MNTTPMTTPAAPNAYDQAANLMSGASAAYGDIANGGILQNINSYMNPFYSQVIDNTFGRMDISRDQGLGMIGDQAEAAGAFGSGRHGLMEGQFLGQDQMNRADFAGNMQAQNFGQASQAARADMFGAAQGATQLGQQYYGIGNDLADRQMDSGNMQQMLMQQLMSGGADQYGQMMQQPYQILDLLNAMNQGDPRNNNMTSTQSSTPGLFDYLSLGAGVLGAKLGAG